MKRALLSAMASTAFLFGAAGAQAQSCQPVNGHFEASVVPPGVDFCPATVPRCTAGRGWGGINGNYRFVMTNLMNAGALGGNPGVFFFVGDSTIAMQDGSTVLGADTGSIDLAGNGGFASLITFNSGGTGQIRLRGYFDAVQGTTSGDYVGQFCGG